MTRPKGKVLPAIRKNVPNGTRVLIAVSGGRDSMCLLHGCLVLAREMDLLLEVVHLDHGLREDSGSDASFVRDWCSAGGIVLHSRKETRPPDGRNVEAWGRERRYLFFREVLTERALDYVLTAHTADDAAETLLMRLISNKELRGIAARDERSRCIRPLLGVTRESVDSYIRENQVPFVEDKSNEDTSFLRNKVRHILIPFLEKEFDPRIVEILSIRACHLDEDEAALAEIAQKRLDNVHNLDPQGRDWVRAFKEASCSMPPGVTWRMIEQVFLPILGYKPSRERAKEALEVVLGNRVGAEFGGGKSVRRQKGTLKF